ncbi:hypothetical protein Fmac_019686 [Flemingia macrophylla]|uniref:Uncharacterized protein n=1 Tax=Flemingia macrophylla TaxID=520843 RepID=A0ABD1MAG4_9FABA
MWQLAHDVEKEVDVVGSAGLTSRQEVSQCGNHVQVCGLWYWVLLCLQFPIALIVFGYKAVKLYKDHKERMSTGNPEFICEVSIEWFALHILFYALCGILGETVGGLVGSGDKLCMSRSQQCET